MTHLTTKRARKKPGKPRPDWPLFAHANGSWAKKIKGRLYYFGPWSDPETALQKYLDTKDYLAAGRTPPADQGGLSVRELVNRYLTARKSDMDRGRITPKTFRDLHRTCARVVDVFGLRRLVIDLDPRDFERLHSAMATTLGLVARGVEIQKTRSIFKWALDEGLIDRAVRFGQGFRAPGKRELRKAKAQNGNGPRMFEAEEIRQMIDATTPHLRAMILLGVNCGFGNNDCATLRLSALDLDGGWVDHPRPKTGTERRCPLWPETASALCVVIDTGRAPEDPAHAGLVFLTQQGRPWVRFRGTAWIDAVTGGCRQLLDKLGLKRPGRNFYALRHTFETIAGETIDQVAIDHVMGHDRGDMASVYRERISDDRLRTVVDHVHNWLFQE